MKRLICGALSVGLGCSLHGGNSQLCFKNDEKITGCNNLIKKGLTTAGEACLFQVEGFWKNYAKLFLVMIMKQIWFSSCITKVILSSNDNSAKKKKNNARRLVCGDICLISSLKPIIAGVGGVLTRRAATFDRVPAPQPGRCILAAPRSGRPNNYSRVQSSLRYGERFPRAGALSAGSPINLMHHSGSGFGPWWFFFFFFPFF